MSGISHGRKILWELCHKKRVESCRVDQDTQKHFSHIPVLRYQGEALHNSGKGAHMVSLNISLYCSACSLAYSKDKNARQKLLCTLELWYAKMVSLVCSMWDRSIAGSHSQRVLLCLNRACSVNNSGKSGTKSIWTSDKQFSYAPKCKHWAKLSGAHVTHLLKYETISKSLGALMFSSASKMNSS